LFELYHRLYAMKNRSLYFLILLLVFESCSSGKTAYKKGDYYEAVLQAIQRLRQKPDHKKSREVLSLSYQAAVDFLESDAQNQINSNANFKWKTAVVNYGKINHLYEEIQKSPGAKQVISNPISKYKELTEVKGKAAEESYEAGLQSMLKNTREDAKQAYFMFSDANNYSPGYREAIEMIEQSKFNATLKVVVEPTVQNSQYWNFESLVFGYTANQFVKFYTPQQSQEANLPRIDQFLNVGVNGYQEERPVITKRVESYKDSVKTGEKVVNSVKVPVYQKVSAELTTYTKVVRARGSASLIIIDAVSRAEIKNQELVSSTSWTYQWATSTGDSRALSKSNRELAAKREASYQAGSLMAQTKRELDQQLSNALSSFYKSY